MPVHWVHGVALLPYPGQTHARRRQFEADPGTVPLDRAQLTERFSIFQTDPNLYMIQTNLLCSKIYQTL
jgi:hypothetical protein